MVTFQDECASVVCKEWCSKFCAMNVGRIINQSPISLQACSLC